MAIGMNYGKNTKRKTMAPSVNHKKKHEEEGNENVN
jgi:hypothetical protein